MKHKHYLFFLYLILFQTSYGQIVTYGADLELCTAETVLTCGNATLDFGEVNIGQESSQAITIKNTGTQRLFIYGYDLSGFEAFSVELGFSIGEEASILPGEELTLNILFTPPAEGTFSGKFALHSSDPDEDPCVIFLEGTGVSPFPLAINFSTDPSQGYEPIDCGDEIYFDETADQTYSPFELNYTFQNQTEGPITVGVVINHLTLNNIWGPNVLNPGPTYWDGAVIWLTPGELHVIEATFTVELADGSIVECVHRVIVDKRAPLDSCMEFYLTDDHKGAYHPVQCGEEINYVDHPELDGDFPLYFAIRNTCDETLTMTATSSLAGTSLFAYMPETEMIPFSIAFFTPTFHLEGMEEHTIITTFSTVEEYPRHCTITVHVDKTGMEDDSFRVSMTTTEESPGSTSLYPTIVQQQELFLRTTLAEAQLYKIFNLSGQLMHSGQTTAGQALHPIRLPQLPGGPYFLRLEGEGKALRFFVAH